MGLKLLARHHGFHDILSGIISHGTFHAVSISIARAHADDNPAGLNLMVKSFRIASRQTKMGQDIERAA
jgi:hypothetical protein